MIVLLKFSKVVCSTDYLFMNGAVKNDEQGTPFRIAGRMQCLRNVFPWRSF